MPDQVRDDKGKARMTPGKTEEHTKKSRHAGMRKIILLDADFADYADDKKKR